MTPQPATINTPRPAAMGTTCDAVFVNPAFEPDGDQPLLLRCKAQAVVKIKYQDNDGRQAVVKRCPACRDILSHKRGVEILQEEVM